MVFLILRQVHTLPEIERMFLMFSALKTNVQSIRDVPPNILSRIAGRGTVGLVTEVEGKTMAFFWTMYCTSQEQNTLFSLQALHFCRGFTITIR